MKEHFPFEHHWTLAPSLQNYFMIAGSIAAVLLVFGIVVNIHSLNEGATPLLQKLPFQIAGTILGVSGAISALLLWPSMWLYWWQVDRRERGMNVFWLLALSLGNWAGATIYYFFVFRKVVKKDRQGVNA